MGDGAPPPPAAAATAAGAGGPAAAGVGAGGVGEDPTISVWELNMGEDLHAAATAAAAAATADDADSAATAAHTPASAAASVAPECKLLAASGRAPRASLVGWLAGGMLGAGPGGGRGAWRLEVSPLGEHVAVVTPWGRWAGLDCTWDFGGRLAVVGSVRDSASCSMYGCCCGACCSCSHREHSFLCQLLAAAPALTPPPPVLSPSPPPSA